MLYGARLTPVRLVVFVHGFKGGATTAWREFGSTSVSDPWWKESDLLFVGYKSLRENLSAISIGLRQELPNFYPRIIDPGLIESLAELRTAPDRYKELLLVGHSLGGVIIRRMLVDCALGWEQQLIEDPNAPTPLLLEAQQRLFSPASAGFRAAGFLGMLRASPGWLGLNMLLRFTSTFSDLQPAAPLLQATRERTERLANKEPLRLQALRAPILWASPDNVVNTERYDTDPLEDKADGRSHTNVCKPDKSYDKPRAFVRDGCLR